MLVKFCMAAVMTMCAAAMAMAQVDNAQPQPRAQGQRGQVRQAQPEQGQAQGQRAAKTQVSGEVDARQLAQMFIIGNQAEVELSKLAAEKTENEQVREFAETMVKDHSAMIAKLQKFAGKANAPERTEVAPRNGDARTTAQTKVEHSGMLGFHQKASQLELAMTKQMLGKYEGQDFDMGYLGQQMCAHTKMLACLTTAKEHGSPEFQAAIEEGITTTREHMQHANQLAARIKNKEYGDGERRESARPALREGDRPVDGVPDGGARPSIRPQDTDVPREGAPRREPLPKPRSSPPETDSAPDSAREEAVP